MAAIIEPVQIAVDRHPWLRSLTHYLSVEVNAWIVSRRVVANALKDDLVFNPECSQS
jgi:hypothetical protein